MKGLGLALAKSVFNEGVALFASFVMLLNFQRFGKMKGMGKVVEWSIRDESMHVEGNAKVFRQFCVEHPKVVDDEFKGDIYAMARLAVKLEDKFVDLAYKMGEIEGLDASEVKIIYKVYNRQTIVAVGFENQFQGEGKSSALVRVGTEWCGPH
jgi:glutaredoxin 3